MRPALLSLLLIVLVHGLDASLRSAREFDNSLIEQMKVRSFTPVQAVDVSHTYQEHDILPSKFLFPDKTDTA